MYVDPYIRISHNRHWLKNNAKKKNKHNKSEAIASTPALIKKKGRHLQHENKFNPEVIDTFCFHWPDMHSYVLVRVLESTIAILPVRSRLAFLYFHHAPLPTHPSPQDLRKALRPVAAAHGSPKRIHDMFKSWKHTLAIDEEKLGGEQVDMGDANTEHEEDLFANKSDSNSSSDDNNNANNTSSSTFNKVTDTPPSTPKVHANVTLSDVLSYERNLRNGWIHASCTVTDDENMFDNNVILTTKHTVLKLTARCFSEKMMFMNLVKLQHAMLRNLTLDAENLDANEDSDIDDDDNNAHPTTRRSSSKSNTTTIGVRELSNSIVAKNFQRETEQKLYNIQQLIYRINAAKQDISDYTRQLLELDQSLDSTMDTTLNIQFGPLKRVLDYVNHQLADSITQYHTDRSRIAQLQERVSVHTAFLKGASQRYEQIKKRVRSHAWYPWLYTGLASLVLLISMIAAYYFYYIN
ncbi:hypothetical protein MAM1_0216c08170 [Mucor ambiguus]|uniref:Uncharacterized protein n=1 Tax=Mucor ambiguus TaxID=91626 RepID=A0A0C9LWJ9_9FUNG|nr:hypothetical protein MAM1_0216c08170 [Mucor ambiguus]